MELLAQNSVEGVVAPLPAPEPIATGDAEETEAEETVTDGADTEGADGADGEADDIVDEGPELIAAPEPLEFRTPEPTAVPPLDSYSLRIAAGRTMYDAGTTLAHSRSSANLAPVAALRLHPHDFDRVGVASGERVRVSANNRTLVVEAVADATVAQGTAALAVNAPNVNVNDLIEAGAPITEIRLEAAR